MTGVGNSTCPLQGLGEFEGVTLPTCYGATTERAVTLPTCYGATTERAEDVDLRSGVGCLPITRLAIPVSKSGAIVVLVRKEVCVVSVVFLLL